MSRFQAVFGDRKPVIAMVHLGASPGAPLYDADRRVEGIFAAARADLRALQTAGFDAVMFGNENDRPYELKVDTATSATMAYIIGRLREEITVPFGVNVLWDPMSSFAVAAATGAAFVAAFIGSPSMNLLEGRISGGKVDVGGTSLPLPAGVSADEGREVIYGIRPEHLHVADQGLTGKVAVIEPTGSETHVVLRLSGRDLTAVFRNRVAFAPGATITLAPDEAVSHLFDKATGNRI
jgi:hypothetical protein